jgi:hypothetical protein
MLYVDTSVIVFLKKSPQQNQELPDLQPFHFTIYLSIRDGLIGAA